MDSTTQKLTAYFRQVQERSNLDEVVFGKNAPFLTQGSEEVRTGRLAPEATAQLFAWASEQRSGAARGRKAASSGATQACPAPDANARPIDLLIGLATVKDGGRSDALLVLPAVLAPDGTLSASLQDAEPWIPATRLHSDGVADLEVMVGDLAAFWKWRTGQGVERRSQVETWSQAMDYSYALLDDVGADLTWPDADDSADGIQRTTCYIKADKVIAANGAILDLYAHYLQEGEKLKAPTYERLLAMDDRERRQSDGIDDDVANLRECAQRCGGSMSDGFPLTASQRRAVHAFHQDGPGSVTAVSGPPGTGKTTMLQAVVASLIVQHALDDKPAPLVVGTSTNNQAVTNVIDSFSSVVKDDPGVLDQRWLPGASDHLATNEALRGLAAYCPAQHRMAAAREKYLVEDRAKTGVYTEYSEPTYVEGAGARFLEMIGRYGAAVGMRAPTTMQQSITQLRKALTTTDDTRKFLIEERARLDARVGQSSSALQARMGQVGQQLAESQVLLQEWQASAARANGEEALDRLFVEMNHREDEPAPMGESCAQYVDFYEARVAELGRQIDDLSHQLPATRAREDAARSEFENLARVRVQMAALFGQFSAERQRGLLTAGSLLELDQQLDVTLRYAEFWLAVHLYEARWLAAIEADELIAPAERWQTSPEAMQKYWTQVTSLTPCFVMTAYLVPRYFKLFTRSGEATKYDLGRVDLLIVDEAGQVDTSLGAASFGVAKRALVVGDEQQLAPVWGIDSQTDEQMAGVQGLGGQWDRMRECGLTASTHSSLMRAAAHASDWCYGGRGAPGLFLAEHFRCHPKIIGYCNELLYGGLLNPQRPIHNYLLNDRTPSPFLFRHVPGSRDEAKGSSRINDREATVIAQWIVDNFAYFDDIYNPDADPQRAASLIGVVTPFAAQASLIRGKLDQAGAGLSKRITVGTAHALQGAERPVVLFSPVYGDTSGAASFIDNTLELMNVAVSRAKDLFIVFGGGARWRDRGPVFSLVHKFAVQSSCDFVGGSALVAVVDAPSEAEPEAPLPEPRPEPDPESPGVVQHGDVREAGPVVETPNTDQIRWVDRHEPGYRTATEMINDWIAAGVVPATRSLSARSLNKALESAGLIRHDAGSGWLPTPEGTHLGIAAYEAADGSFRSPIYSPSAQAALAQMIGRGELTSR